MKEPHEGILSEAKVAQNLASLAAVRLPSPITPAGLARAILIGVLLRTEAHKVVNSFVRQSWLTRWLRLVTVG